MRLDAKKQNLPHVWKSKEIYLETVEDRWKCSWALAVSAALSAVSQYSTYPEMYAALATKAIVG